MPFPKQKDIEIPLLRALDTLGGEAKPRDVYPLVAQSFPELSPEEQEQRLESHPGTRKWWNLVQWVRQRLVQEGQVDASTRGVWKITPAGSARLRPAAKASTAPPRRQAGESKTAREVDLRDLANTNLDEVKARLLTELKNLSPRAFEHFCKEFLRLLGYKEVTVTRRTADGGIDGFGDFRQGAVSIKSAFQAKRWTDTPVGRPDIDRLRGSIQGDYDHGVFLTTSRFTRDAEKASYKKGAITILLLDGQTIANLMVERGIGVIRVPVYLTEIDSDFFQFEDERE